MNGNFELKALHLYDLLPKKWSGIRIQVGLFGNTFWPDKFKHNYDTKLEKLTEWSDVTIWLIYNCAKLFVTNCWDWSSGIIRVPSNGKSLSDTLRKQIRLFSRKFFSWNVSRQMWRKTSHLDLMTFLLLWYGVWLRSLTTKSRRIDSNALTSFPSRDRLPLNDCLASRKEKTISFRLWIGKALKLKLSGSSQVLTWSSQNAKRVVSNVFLNINICQFRFLQMRISSIVENLLNPWGVDPPELFCLG